MYSEPNKAKQRTPIHKAKGITPSERYLNGLGENSFLSLWSYPGVFRKQKKQGQGDGKELCDMLVVFDKHILIFSDKHCEFPSPGNLQLDWKRWYKRAVQKSAEQAWGAERWIKSFPEKVYLDRACTEPFPLDIPREDAKYHLIVIAHGSEGRCKTELGGSGSLMFSSSLGEDVNLDELSSTPFMIGDLDKKKAFVHVLTETTLDILLQTLDTITDFVLYLDKKEKFIRRLTSVNIPGEEELLAFYLANLNENGEHNFVLDEKFNAFGMEEGFWDGFCESPERQEQIKQNTISYAWDNLIERFSFHAMNATQYFTNHLKLSDTEKGLRLMAREPRTVRRAIMKGLIDLYSNTPDGTRRVKYLHPTTKESPFYVFLSLPRIKGVSYEQYREVRGKLLEAHLMVIKYKFPNILDLVGVASEPITTKIGASEDFIYLDAREWSPELDQEAAELQKELNIFTSPKATFFRENEYPET